ncbi:MAG: beta-lactamase family protein [Clostridia bacterium]|nr:beta-lactamase family protein [Clostridia bacterium]
MSALESFDSILKRHIAEKDMAGASYAVVINGETAYKNCVGHANLEKDIPLSSDTIMRLASMTKPITGVAVMKACELGLLRLDDPVEKYIPEFAELTVADIEDGKVVGSHPAKNRLFVLDLLNHTSGLGMGTVPQDVLAGITAGDTLETKIPLYAKQPLDFEPRTAAGYSATMAFDVACRIVEIVSGMEYEAFIRRYILDPLGMKDTGYELTEEMESRLAVMYHCTDGKIVPSRPEQIILPNVPGTYRCGGTQMFSTLDDYTKFALMLANDGELNGVRILSKESVDAIATSTLPESIRCGSWEEWGISVRVIQHKSEPSQMLNKGAFGWSGAYETHFFIDRELKMCAVLFKNVTSGLGAGAVTSREFETEVMKLFN